MMWRVFVILFLFFFITYSNAQSVLDKRIPFSAKQVSLENALVALGETHKIGISFGNDLIPKKIITIDERDASIRNVLLKLLFGTRIGFKDIDGQIVLFKKKPPPLRKFTISGYIEDKSTGEKLIGTNIYINNTNDGTSTNNYGFYSLTLVEGIVSFNVSYLGYEAILKNIRLQKDLRLDLKLEPSLTLVEIVVTAQDTTFEGIALRTSDKEDISIEQIKLLPTLGGEADVLRTGALLPGIHTGTDGVGGLLVRGGSVDQNLVLLDGVSIYNPVHAIGLFSVFNSDAVRSASVHKGSFPARYGGRLSSIVDIRTKEGNQNKFAGEGSLGLISGKLVVEGPFVKEKSSFFLSARRSVTDLYLPFISRQIKERNENDILGENVLQKEGYSDYHFYDFNGKINADLSKKDRLFLSVYAGGDRFYDEDLVELRDSFLVNFTLNVQDWEKATLKDISKSSFNWGNEMAALRWNRIISDKLFFNTTLRYSRYNFRSNQYYSSIGSYDNGTQDTILSVEKYRLDIQNEGIKTDFEYIPSPRHYIRFGAEFSRYKFQPGIFISDLSLSNIPLYNANIALFDTTKTVAQQAYETTLYIEDDWQMGERFKVNIGLHGAHWKADKKDYFSVQPRISATLLMGQNWAIRASYSQMVQHLHFLTKSSLGLPSDVWVPSTSEVRPERAWQSSLGVSYHQKNHWEISLEAYYKKLDDIITLSRGDSLFLVDANDWEEAVVAGQGWAYGLEFFVKRTVGKTRGWLSYTWARSDRQFDAINGGKRFPFRYDRRHSLNISLQHIINDHWSINSSWIYESGARFTLPSYQYPVRLVYGNIIVRELSSENGVVTASYQRLDLGVSYQLQKKWGTQIFNFGVFNAYNRQNPIFIKYRAEDDNFVQVTLLPVLPSLSYTVKF